MTPVLDRPRALPTGWTEAEWEALIAALTRRRFIAGSLALGVVTFLPGCGDDDPASIPAGTTTPATRTIETANGPVEIPTTPKRVVCVINYAMHDLFDLDFEPIGVPDGFADDVLPKYAGSYQKIAKVGPWNAIDVEKVAALNPDLILGLDSDWNEPIYDKLRGIAPTALFKLAGTSDWAAVAAEFAGAVGRTKQLDALKQQYQDRAASIHSTYSSVLDEARWAIVTAPPSGWVTWFPDSSGGQVLAAAGVQFSSIAAGKTGNYQELSIEQLDLLADADAIAVYDNPGSPNPNVQKLKQQPAWALLKAAKNDHVYALPQLFPYSYGNALALLDQLEEALKSLKGGQA